MQKDYQLFWCNVSGLNNMFGKGGVACGKTSSVTTMGSACLSDGKTGPITVAFTSNGDGIADKGFCVVATKGPNACVSI